MNRKGTRFREENRPSRGGSTPWYSGSVFVLAALFFICSTGLSEAAKWTTYKNCKLAENPSNDGDSFHVMVKGKEHIYRLYFVDAPETSRMIPDRIAQQAEYWDIREAQVLAAGREAKSFTHALLTKPFTVYTRGEDAKGQSTLPREFALIETSEGYLCELITAAGLARVYGLQRELPDGTDAKSYVHKLDVLEKTARKKRLGAWRTRATRLSQMREEATDVKTGAYLLQNSITLYTTNSPTSFAGAIPKGTIVQVLGAESTMLLRVSFQQDDKETQGLCRRTELAASGVAMP